MTQYSGIGVSPGVAYGPVFHIRRIEVSAPVPASPRQVFAALDSVADDLERRAAAAAIDVAREVLEAQSMIARDPALVEAIGARLTDDVTYPDVRESIRDAFAGFRAALESLGGYFAERVNDLDEIADRTIDHLAGVERAAAVLSQIGRAHV